MESHGNRFYKVCTKLNFCLQIFVISVFNTEICLVFSWYHQGMDRAAAEDMLKCIPHDGAFLVRRSETDQFSYAISFR